MTPSGCDLCWFGPLSQASLGRQAQMDRSDVTAAAGELLARVLRHHASTHD
jgi:hypothetical protein